MSRYVCSAQEECTLVECLGDGDCGSRVCDAERHVCVQCREDANCTGSYKHCNVQTATCVQCGSDANCSGLQARCDLATNSCQQCLTNADCTPDSPRCDPTIKFCGACKEDADCAGSGKPVCENLQCRACRSDQDCKDPAFPACIASFSLSACVECLLPTHCPDGKACINQACVAP